MLVEKFSVFVTYTFTK